MTSNNKHSFFDKIFSKKTKEKRKVNKKTPSNDSLNEINNKMFAQDAIFNRPYPFSEKNNNFLKSNQSYTFETQDKARILSSEPPNKLDLNLLVIPDLNNEKDLTPIKEEDSLFRYIDMNPTPIYNQQLSNNNESSNTFLQNDVFHRFHVTSYMTPTFCDYCSQLLFGLIKQGLRCEFCNQNFHKRCIVNMPKICNHQLNIAMKSNSSKHSSYFGNHMETNQIIEIEHTFFKKQMFDASRPSLKCEICQHKLTGSSEKVYWQCRDCTQNVHAKCLKHVKKNCKPLSVNEDENNNQIEDFPMEEVMQFDASDDLDSIKIEEKTEDITDISFDLANSKLTNLNNQPHQQIQEFNQTNKPTEEKFHFNRNRNRNRNTQISAKRISQRLKPDGCFWSGHMIYYTNKKLDRVTHYWKLDSKSILIFDTYRLEKKLNELNLSDIRKATLCGLNINSKDDYLNDQKCLFILWTDNQSFFCGIDNSEQNNPMNVLARNFYNIFKMAYLPYASSRNGLSRASLKITAPKYEEKNLKDEYVINPQELLGSGQFGQVYGGICKVNNQQVAIKVIDKTRFKDFQAETSVFQNEITILYNVQHPGIVRLYALFDEVEHLYIVTEKMATDMLEMILNKNPARLTERVSKFIIYQILIALKKLHDLKIAHCDLKPENILLTQNVEFPQVKLCDFGYAKIIGENSFRRSMVGTPAYSPPELKQKRLYNNSIDMWSMGVIIYVSLSGTFPFEEDRDIYEQILNSNFMFPPETWDHVSKDAIGLITNFLQVKIDRRMSVDKALQHRWFSEDSQVYFDLAELENKVQLKWLTTLEQQQKWLIPDSIHL